MASPLDPTLNLITCTKFNITFFTVRGGKGACGRGYACQGGMHGRKGMHGSRRPLLEGPAWQEKRPLQRTVRILLECILVNKKIQDEGPLRLTSFTREELDKCLEFLKENCYVRRDEDERPVVYTVGIGAYQFGKRFEEALNVK